MNHHTRIITFCVLAVLTPMLLAEPTRLGPPAPISIPTTTTAPTIFPVLHKPLPTLNRSTLSLRCDDAIPRAVHFLLSRQRPDGSWNDLEGTDGQGGQTAIVALALLSAGEGHQTPALTKAVNFLRHLHTNHTYSVALRACVYAQLPESMRQAELRADLAWLQKAMISNEAAEGLYTYTTATPNDTGDYSNSQYGVLGAWYAAEAGLEVPTSFWHRAEKGWLRGQTKDGGWGYTNDSDNAYASMTAAGAATLFITNDFLHAHEAGDLFRLPSNHPLDRAVNWLGTHFAIDRNPGRDSSLQPENADLLAAIAPTPPPPNTSYVHYMLFGYERVGEASGLTRFGSHKWFDEGADALCKSQLPDGSWSARGDTSGSPEVETAYCLLFLSRGQSPVAMQKLAWGNRWNNRPRDLADFVHFLRHATERHLNWQIVNSTATVAEMSEAPVLYAASDRPVKLTDAEKQSIKDYILRGGLLLCANEGRTDDFAKSIEKLGPELFPDYTFHDVPPTDSLLAGNFPAKNLTEPILALGNGIRRFIVLLPTGDIPWKWQIAGGSPVVKLSPYNAAANLWTDCLGGDDPLLKGQSTWFDRDPTIPAASRALHVARLKYAGNWNPEPAGWQRLSSLLHNARDMELTTDEMPITSLDAAHPLAHLTATTELKLTPPEESALKTYLDHGGLLLFDSAGGSPEAASSIQAILARLYPSSRNEPLPPTHAIYGQGDLFNTITYRRSEHLSPSKLPRLRGITDNGKLLAIVSAEDLSAGLVGYPTAGFPGYSPTSSAELVRAIVDWVSQTRR